MCICTCTCVGIISISCEKVKSLHDNHPVVHTDMLYMPLHMNVLRKYVYTINICNM